MTKTRKRTQPSSPRSSNSPRTSTTSRSRAKTKAATVTADGPPEKARAATATAERPPAKAKATTAMADGPPAKARAITATAESSRAKAKTTTATAESPRAKAKTTTATVKQTASDGESQPMRFNYRRASSNSTIIDESHKRRHAPVRRWKLVRLSNQGRVEVVGESNYQEALIEITGRSDWTDVHHECMAILIIEPRNPHDPNAIRVEIKRRKVGYLSREDAIGYAPYLRKLARHGKLPCCEALISGRGEGADSLTKNMGVFLRVSPPGSELLAKT